MSVTVALEARKHLLTVVPPTCLRPPFFRGSANADQPGVRMEEVFMRKDASRGGRRLRIVLLWLIGVALVVLAAVGVDGNGW